MAKVGRSRFQRGSEEFTRVVTLSDHIFGFAMTLLVVTVAVPSIEDGASVDALGKALADELHAVLIFFISFAVIGRYWRANHRFLALLGAMDTAYIRWTLVFLAFIALLPFPTDLLGDYFENPLSLVVYAVAVSVVSGLEVVLFRQAHRSGLFHKPMPEAVYRWRCFAALLPVAVFPLSIPLAFIDTTVASLTWLLVIPLGLWADRFKPEGADELLR